jgi:hypothetical protein
MTDQFICLMGNGRLSKSGTLEEIMVSAQRNLPAQILYTIIPNPDGKGLQLLEVGRFKVVFQSTVGDSKEVELSAPQPAQPPTSPEVMEPAGIEPATDGFKSAEPAPAVAPQLPLFPAQEENTTPAPVAKRQRKVKAKPSPVVDQDDDDNIPNPTARPGGTMQVTTIIKATPLQAEQASLFGQSN